MPHNHPKVRLWPTHSPAQKALTQSAAPTKPSPQSLDDHGGPRIWLLPWLPASVNSSPFLYVPLPPALSSPCSSAGIPPSLHTPNPHRPPATTSDKTPPTQSDLPSPSLPRLLPSLHVLVCWLLSDAGVKGILLEGVSCEAGVASCLSSSFDCPQHSVLHIIQTHWMLPAKCRNTWSVLAWLPEVALSHTRTQSSAWPGRKVLWWMLNPAQISYRPGVSWLLSEGSLSQLLINATYDNFLKQVVILSRLLSELKKQWEESPFIPVLWSQVLLTRWNITSDWTHFSWKQRKYVYLRLWMKNMVKNRKCSGIICS